MSTLPRLAWRFRALNAALRPVARRSARFGLDADALLADARRETGLDDFGDDGFRTGLSRLLGSLEREAALSPLGRIIARSDVARTLRNRLELQDWRTRHPEIGDEKVERPIVIMGQGRTGTTILHDLMAQDPANRVPMTWEVDAPCPPPETASYGTDARIAEIDAQLDRTDQLLPDFKKMHPMGARLPQECVRILSHDFASMIAQLSYRVPDYARWLHDEADLGFAYRGHRRFLQHLQWRHPGRWVLKSPGHLWHVRALLAEYPDAVLVQTHRDPLRVLASLTSLGCTLRSMCSDDVDPHAFAREWSDWNARAYDHSVDVREDGSVPAERILDVQFREFVADPIATVRRVYAHAQLDLDPRAEERMRRFLAENPADKHGRHHYRFADTGLDPAEEREKVRRYQDYFDVAEEPA